MPQFLSPGPGYTRTGQLSIEGPPWSDSYVFYHACREQLHEIADLLSSPTGCPSCGDRDVALSTDVEIDPGSGHDDGQRSTAVCESCAESLHETAHQPNGYDDGRSYCIPEWLATPPWEREKRTFTSDEFAAATVAPAPVDATDDSHTHLGTREAESFEVRKAFHELIEGCRVTLGIREIVSDEGSFHFLAVRGLVESVDPSADPPRRYLSVGAVDGTSPKPEQFRPDRVILLGRQDETGDGRGADQYQWIEARVESWRRQTESPHFEPLFRGYVTGLEYQSPTNHDYTVPATAPIEGYPPEPDPPAAVTELATTTLEDGKLSVELEATEKQWVAHLTGLSDQYEFSRDWVAVAKPGRHSGSVSGTTDLPEGEFIEVGWDSRQQFRPPESEYSGVEENPYKIRRYFRVEQGELVECESEDVETELG